VGYEVTKGNIVAW